MTDDLSRRLAELEASWPTYAPSWSRYLLRRRRRHDATCCGWRPPPPSVPPAPASHRAARRAASGGTAILGQSNVADAVTGFQNNGPFSDISGPGPIALQLSSPGGHLQFVGAPGDTVLGTYPIGTLAYNASSGLELWQPSLGPDPRPTLLARPGTAGALTLLFEPVRVYDSRPNAVPELPTDGRITTGQVRTIGLLDSGAEGFGENIDGVMINLTVTDTIGWGFLTVFSAGIAATPNVSSINWFEGGMTVANHVVSAVDLAQLKVACGGGGSTHFIVDVIGVYG